MMKQRRMIETRIPTHMFLMALAASAPLRGGGKGKLSSEVKKEKKERTSEFIPNVDGTSTVT